MFNAIKKLSKGVIILLCCLILIPVFIIIFLAILQGCAGKKISYDKYENKMVAATKKYLKKEKLLPKEEAESIVVNLDDLVSEGYIKSPEDLVKDKSCVGSVTVRLNGSNEKSNNGGIYNYNAQLKCDKYKSKSLINLMMEDLTTQESGLYKVNNTYVYKGDRTNNYLKFYGVLYRIINVDEAGIVKLVKEDPESAMFWDNKYNSKMDQNLGKNIYKDSYIVQKLNDFYITKKKLKLAARDKVVAYDVCIDAKNIDDVSIPYKTCQNVLENQYITLLDVRDFANASLDPECTSLDSKSCRNYNYMKSMNLSTWTINAVSDDDYQVYYFENGYLRYTQANYYLDYNVVIHIDGQEIVKSGDGSKKTPYVIE